MSTYGYALLSGESVSATTATPTVALGTRRLEDGTEYIYAYNGGAEAIKGCPVIMTATSGYTFVSTFAVADDLACTVLGTVHNATCAAGSYCWVAAGGIANAYVATAVAAQDMISILDGGGQCDVVSFGSALTQILVIGSVIGRAMEATAASAVVKVMIRDKSAGY